MRPAKYEGMFYPGDPDKLAVMIDDFLKNADTADTLTDKKKRLKAIIVPHAGYTFSGQTAAYAYKLIPENIKHVILIGPFHRYPVNGIASSAESWETPLKTFDVTPLENELVHIDERPHANEHSLEVQLPFLQRVLGDDIKLTVLGTNNTDTEKAADTIEQMLDENTLLILSSDLSHFYDRETAKKLDDKISKDITEKNVENLDRDEACGLMGIKIAVEIARKRGWTIEELHRSTSAEITGETEQVVGYGSYGIFV